MGDRENRDHLLELGEWELRRRLEDPDLAEKIPPGQLITFLVKLQDEKAKEPDPEAVREPTPLELVRSAPNLPNHKKAEMLVEYARELRETLDEVEREIGGLGGD